MSDRPRVEPLSLEEAQRVADEVGIPDEMARLNVFRVLLRDPVIAGAVHGLLASLLWKGLLDVRLRELLVMRIGWRTGSVYEWTQHWHVARLLDVDEADLLAVREWETSDRFGAIERAVLAATDETLDDGVIGKATWAACAQHLDDGELVELVVAIGNWRLFSSLLQSLDIPLEDGLDAWPPDGVAPDPPVP